MNKITFGTGAQVTASTFFSQETGFGLVEQSSVPGATTAEQSLHNGGWNCAPSFCGGWKDAVRETACGVYVSDERNVLVFKIAVRSYGVYKVTVTVRADAGDIRGLSLFSGRRAAVVKNVAVEKGAVWTKSWYVLSAPYIPAFASKAETEKAIYISVSGKNAGFSQVTVEKASAPVLWIAGDSTLTDQNALFPYYGGRSCGGWAQAFSRYLNGFAVCNYAHSGMTTNCFRDDGHWKLIQKYAHPGDVVFFQFGHNDQKRRNLSAAGGYSTNLRRYVRETRELGAIPVIVSPLSRIPAEDRGMPVSMLKAYAEAAAHVAAELEVPFINLHDMTFAFWCELKEKAATYFMPGDITHTNDYGADFCASLVAQEIKRLAIAPLADSIVPDVAPVLPPEHEVLPPAEAAGASIFDIPMPYVDAGTGKTRETILRAFRNGLLDPCVLHVHPKDMLPRAQLLMVLFKAIRQGGKRPYLGAFDDISRYEWDAGYIQACLDAGLIDAPASASGALFFPDEPVTADYFAMLTVRALEKNVSVRQTLSKELCLERARKLGLISAQCSARCRLSRELCYGGLVRLQELLDTADAALPSDVEMHPSV
ncbi:MAG: hypothetical protein K6G80_07885 [Treponema sp.]|nr:hypothetical protein [Treponema sp.]